MTELQQYIHSYFDIPPQHLSPIEQLFETRILKKNDFLIKTGGYHGELSFVQEGYLRVYEEVEGKDVTQWIISKGEFSADLACLSFGMPARRNVQALSEVKLYSISSSNYEKIELIIPEWPHLEKLFISKCFLTLEQRIFSFLSMSAEQRYQQLFALKPDLFNHVPLHYLASMMGMTPETLSRIRRKIIS